MFLTVVTTKKRPLRLIWRKETPSRRKRGGASIFVRGCGGSASKSAGSMVESTEGSEERLEIGILGEAVELGEEEEERASQKVTLRKKASAWLRMEEFSACTTVGNTEGKAGGGQGGKRVRC